MNQINRRYFIKQTSTIGVSALALTMMPTKLLANKNSNTKIELPYASWRSHLLNRTSFGINDELKFLYDDLGHKGFIDYQLDADSIDDSEIESYIAGNLPTVNMPISEIRDLIDNRTISQFKAADELKFATYLRAIYSNKQLLQVMTEFWSNHFSVFHFDGPVAVLKTLEDREVIRPLALSTFSEILHANAKSSAMIYYLDSFSSSKEAPNENYARELLELHTLGVDGPYTHHDIDEVARCFTGWRINQGNGAFRFSDNNHDIDKKQVLGHTIAANGGITDGEQVIDILANHPSTAAFISYKLCQHFISDQPDKSIVDSTTAMFLSTGGDIKKCLKHILISKHFLISQDMKLKRPFNYCTAVVRVLSGDILNDRSSRLTRVLLDALGHQPFNWATPDGYPDVAKYWKSTTGMLYRWDYVNLFCFDDFDGYSFSLAQVIQEPHTSDNILQQISEKIINREMTTTDKDSLLAYLNSDSSDGNVSTTKIRGALAIVLGSPYFQLT